MNVMDIKEVRSFRNMAHRRTSLY